jgi:hypothetical protein
MKYIKRYNGFDDILYVFDLDNTLVKTPSFEDIAKKYIKESNLPTVYDLLNKSVDAIGVSIKDLKWENGRIFIQDDSIEPIRNWVKKKTRLYLTSPDVFSYIDESMPYAPNEKILNLYKSERNRLILVEYDSLVKDTENTMKAIYSFIDEPYYQHDFNNVERNWDDYDSEIGIKLHRIRKKVEFIPRNCILPPDITQKYSGMEVWRL